MFGFRFLGGEVMLHCVHSAGESGGLVGAAWVSQAHVLGCIIWIVHQHSAWDRPHKNGLICGSRASPTQPYTVAYTVL